MHFDSHTLERDGEQKKISKETHFYLEVDVGITQTPTNKMRFSAHLRLTMTIQFNFFSVECTFAQKAILLEIKMVKHQLDYVV